MAARHPILIAEDSSDDYFLIHRLFEKGLSSVKLFHVPDGAKAIDYLQGVGPYQDRIQYPLPELVITDLKMPRVSGFELLEWMRSHEPFNVIPVIVVSGSDEPQDLEKASQLGVREYVAKGTLIEGADKLMSAVAKCCAEIS